MPIYEYETVHEPVPPPPGHRRRTLVNALISFFGLAFFLAVPAHLLLFAADAFFDTRLAEAYAPVRDIALIPFRLISELGAAIF